MGPGLRYTRRALISTPARAVLSAAVIVVVGLATWVSLEWSGPSAGLAVAILGGLGLLRMGWHWNRRDERAAEPQLAWICDRHRAEKPH